MSNYNRIGLESQHAEKLIGDLNVLLANFQLYYQNLRGIHWNIQGPHFFQLHEKFEELYTDAQQKIDEVAERVLTLGGRPLHSYSAYLENSSIAEAKDVSDPDATVALVLDNLKQLISNERPIIERAAEAGDEGTVDMLSAFVAEQEKTSWMMAAWLGKQ